MQFKKWLNENWGKPDDPTTIEARPGAVIYKWVMKTYTQDQWDAEMHSAREIDRSISHQHTKDNPFKQNTEYEKGSGGTPPLQNGQWEMHKFVKMDDESYKKLNIWGNPTTHDERIEEFQYRQMSDVTEEAKKLVQQTPDVYAAMVMLVQPREGGNNFHSAPTKINSYIIATSKTPKGNKKVSIIRAERSWQDVSEKNQTQINNALSKQMNAFDTEPHQYRGFNRASSISLRDVMHADVFGHQYRSWRWHLVLTKDGWQAHGSEHGPSRTLGGTPLFGGAAVYQDKFNVSVTVHFANGNWEIEDVYVPKANLSGFQRKLANARQRHILGRRANSAYGDRFTGRYDDVPNVQQGDTYIRNSEEFDQALQELIASTPWMQRFSKVANPFLISKSKWNQVVEGAILRVLDDNQYAKPAKKEND